MIVLTLVFHKIAKVPSVGGVPYPVLVYAAILSWQFFAAQLSSMSSSLISNSPMVSKAYFPKIILPLAKLLIGFVDFVVSMIPMILFFVYYKISLTVYILLLPALLFLLSLFTLGLGSFFAAVNVKYRDLKFVIPFFIQIGFYCSPVGFSASLVPSDYFLLYSFNPMVSWIEGFRVALLGCTSVLPIECYLVSLLVTIVVFVFGVRYFYRKESSFADFI